MCASEHTTVGGAGDAAQRSPDVPGTFKAKVFAALLHHALHILLGKVAFLHAVFQARLKISGSLGAPSFAVNAHTPRSVVFFLASGVEFLEIRWQKRSKLAKFGKYVAPARWVGMFVFEGFPEKIGDTTSSAIFANEVLDFGAVCGCDFVLD